MPDEVLRRKVFENYAEWLAKTPEEIDRNKEQWEYEHAAIQRDDKLLKAVNRIFAGLLHLHEAAHAGDRESAKYLAEVATCATAFLASAEAAQPELFRDVARGMAHWPVMANYQPGWEKAAILRVSELDLGACMRTIHVRFRSMKGTDANLPARRWAKAAVRAAEETRWRIYMVGQLIRDFGSSGAFADFCIESGWEIGNDPDWVKAVVELKLFSQESLANWKPVVREIIRNQVNDFHTLPEWRTQRNTAAANGKDSKGEIQNAILDDIVSALAKLAPESSC